MITVFAPATSANIGPGFDLLGVAIDGLGDRVTVRRRRLPGVVIEHIEGDDGQLPREANKNTAGIAARETLRLLGVQEGVVLRLQKGLPLGSGLGSSAASAVAAAWAVNVLFGQPLSKQALLEPCLVAEASIGGWHADNVGPALFGGFLLIRSYEPLDLIQLPTPSDLLFVLVTPDYELLTAMAREALPKHVSLKQHIANNGNLAALVAALFKNSPTLLGRAVEDGIVEPARAPLIPGFAAVKAAALEAGALGCSISGAGPTLFALSDNRKTAKRIASAMQHAFEKHGGLSSRVHVAAVDRQGTRIVS